MGTTFATSFSRYLPSGSLNARIGKWTVNAAASATFIPKDGSEMTSVRLYPDNKTSFSSLSKFDNKGSILKWIVDYANKVSLSWSFKSGKKVNKRFSQQKKKNMDCRRFMLLYIPHCQYVCSYANSICGSAYRFHDNNNARISNQSKGNQQLTAYV
ncbi:hypothetical protein [Parabacteroides chinchillae]|uniref:Uncharacterized protein n=1 Tax=Parabacteroides chinchillae TaxID=871327 RepID=A0A8G2F489_9BACT|nr:hypothetical protein [Parabacteroides chinchillae]SEF60280.1 hypothetical protein SAMN05444001_10390 [Parabacteroides chinchillae]